jgi:hypothetical protein
MSRSTNLRTVSRAGLSVFEPDPYSHEQLRAILRVAAPLEQRARGAFLEEVARELAAKKSRGSLRT